MIMSCVLSKCLSDSWLCVCPAWRGRKDEYINYYTLGVCVTTNEEM